jgi:uncharacterized protein involved in exopolysaccharide biosynthesis
MTGQHSSDARNAPIMDLIKTILRRKNLILIFCAVGFISAVIFSGPMFIEPVYKSEVILYPPNTNSNKILIEKDPRFGSDDDVDQQIQILKSGLVRDSVIRKYNLMKHYKIDTASALKIYKLTKEYESNVRVERTRYNSVSVTVYDTDPLLAAAMANDIVKICDRVKSEVLKQNLSGAFHSLEKEYTSALNETDLLADQVSKLLGKSFVTGISFENKSGPNQLKEQIDLQQAIVQARKTNQNYLLGLLYDYQSKLQRLMELRWSYDQAAGYINLDVPSSYVISPAEVNFKKDSPNRTLLIFLATLCSFLVATACVVVSEKYKSLSAQ